MTDTNDGADAPAPDNAPEVRPAEPALVLPDGWVATTNIRRTAKIGKLAMALAAAQGEFSTVKKLMQAGGENRDTGAKKTYVYADLADFVEMTRGPLAAHGLCVIQAPQYTQGGEILIETGLVHGESDQELWNDFVMVPAKNAHDPQGLGSVITYARRYTYCALLGLVAEKDDDDANKGSGHTERETQRMREPAPQRYAPAKTPFQHDQDKKAQAAADLAKKTGAAPKPAHDARDGEKGVDDVRRGLEAL